MRSVVSGSRTARGVSAALAAAAILTALAEAGEGGLAAGDLSSRLSVKPSLMTAHLNVLRSAGLVHSERQGKFAIYHLSGEAVDDAIEALTLLLSKH